MVVLAEEALLLVISARIYINMLLSVPMLRNSESDSNQNKVVIQGFKWSIKEKFKDFQEVLQVL